jgi:hypothetical protein
MQKTPEEEIERRKITALIDEKDRFITTVRKSIGVAQKPLEVNQDSFINFLGGHSSRHELCLRFKSKAAYP